MTRHFFFDMDGTLTRSRSEISDTMVACLRGLLANGGDVVVVSGATKEQIIKQVGEITKEVVVLAQNGNHAESQTGETLWRNELTDVQKSGVFDLVNKMIGHADLTVNDPADLVEDRVCQISYSLIGHNARLEDKEMSDPEKIIRRGLLCRFEADVEELKCLGVHSRIGGTTCVDFTTRNKGENVKYFIEQMGWDHDDCVYVGDALFEGGNDHSVVGVIPTLAVESPKECEVAVYLFVEGLK